MRNAPSRVAERARRLRFERLVNQVFRGLPDRIHDELDNVEIVVEDEPRSRHLDGASDELFGLYLGTPLSERGGWYTLTVPDVITLFRGPLERAFPNSGELKSQVRITLLHEIAHHLGIDEEDVAELGLA
jgi:predicted Zn-dependent protease with MMP-like domain